jgi:hypothetical protein
MAPPERQANRVRAGSLEAIVFCQLSILHTDRYRRVNRRTKRAGVQLSGSERAKARALLGEKKCASYPRGNFVLSCCFSTTSNVTN